MSEVLIKGMKIPKSCKECKVACEPYLSLDGLLAKISMSDSVRSDCPLIEVPPVDAAEVRRGKWIKDEDGCVVCSICSNPDEINGISGEFMYNNFCANCGADMRRDGEQ